MRACTASCLGSLPGDYETPRVARVPSKPLALANTCIVAFVVMFYLVYMFNSQKYLALESPDGTARLRLQAPTLEPGCVPGSRAEGGRGCPGFVDAEQLPYCDSGTPEPGQIPNIAKNYTGDAALTRPCQFRDEFFAWYPQVEHNALFATTRVTEKQQRVPAGCATSGGRKEKHCVDWATESSDVFYVSQLEDFTLLIDHSFIAPLAKTSAASFDPKVEAGWICKVCDEDDLLSQCSDSCVQGDDNEIDPCDDYISRGLTCPGFVHIGMPRDEPKCSGGSQCRDVLPLRTLLRAAGILDLDTTGDYVDENGHKESHRYAGLVLTVQIKYTNHGPSMWWVPAHWSVHRYNYHYEVKHTKGQSYKGMQVLSADIIHDSKRVVIERHGLRIIFEVTGSIGRWDFGELLVNLAAASSVLAIGTLIIEQCVLSGRCSKRCGFDDSKILFQSAKYDHNYKSSGQGISSSRLSELQESLRL